MTMNDHQLRASAQITHFNANNPSEILLRNFTVYPVELQNNIQPGGKPSMTNQLFD
jgi:hypothetical protein